MSLKLAIDEAMKSEHTTHKHGAVVYKRKQILQSGRNQYCSAKRIRHFNSDKIWSIHAEMNALAGLPRKMTRNADIVIVRVNKRGDIVNSKPCEICMGLIRSAQIRRVLYSTDDGTIHSEWV